MSICPVCNAINPVDYQFCQFCGAKIVSEVISEVDDQIVVEGVVIDASLDSEIIDNAIAVTIPMNIPEPQKMEISIEAGSLEIPNLEISLNGVAKIQLQDISYAGKTDVGRQRDRNEDDFVTIFQTRSIHGKSQISDRSQRGLFVLCDGMGGHEGGAEASKTAVNSIANQFLPFWVDTLPGQKKLNEIIANANQEIFLKNESESRQALGRMGTTLVMLTIHDLKVAIAHVGDSRIYKVTNNVVSEHGLKELEGSEESISLNCKYPKLEQITRDHEVFNQLIDLGIDRESALARPEAHQLTQALGPNPNSLLEPAIQFLTLTESTLFLLCSDGLSDNEAIEQNWQTHLLPILNKEVDLETGLDRLIELGNNTNGYDNITAILVLCDVIPV